MRRGGGALNGTLRERFARWLCSKLGHRGRIDYVAELCRTPQPADAPRYIELANPAAEDDPDAAARAYAARMGDRWEHMGEEARQRARELAAQRLEPPL